MDKKLIEKIYSEERNTLFFLNRIKKCDNIDLSTYRILDYLFQNNTYSLYYKKTDLVLLLLSYWQKLLTSFTSSEEDEENDPIYKTFVEGYNKYTEEYDMNQKIELLYRFPWHINIILQSASKRNINHNYIHNISQFKELSQMSFGKSGWTDLNIIDKIAAYTILDDITAAKYEDKLSQQLKYNLHTIFKAINDLEKIIKKEQIIVEEKDKHAYNIIMFLLDYYMKNKEKLNHINFYEYLYLTVFSMCKWHLEATDIQPKWSFQKPLTQRIKEMLKFK